jgi:hypothetical protein
MCYRFFYYCPVCKSRHADDLLGGEMPCREGTVSHLLSCGEYNSCSFRQYLYIYNYHERCYLAKGGSRARCEAVNAQLIHESNRWLEQDPDSIPDAQDCVRRYSSTRWYVPLATKEYYAPGYDRLLPEGYFALRDRNGNDPRFWLADDEDERDPRFLLET